MTSHPFTSIAIDDLPADIPAILELLADTHPTIALALVRALEGADTLALRATANRLLETLANDSRLDQEVDAVVARAGSAQEMFENWTDERIDGLLLDVAKALAESAKELAIATVKETGMGDVPDKTRKNRFASLRILRVACRQDCPGPAVPRRRSTGDGARESGRRRVRGCPRHQSGRDRDVQDPDRRQIAQCADPEFSSSGAWRRPTDSGIVREVLQAHGAPADLVQCVERPSRKTTRRFMRHAGVALVLATGGAGTGRGRLQLRHAGHWRRPRKCAGAGSAPTPMSIARPVRSWRASRSTTAWSAGPNTAWWWIVAWPFHSPPR